jgi:hypothetical protein
MPWVKAAIQDCEVEPICKDCEATKLKGSNYTDLHSELIISHGEIKVNFCFIQIIAFWCFCYNQIWIEMYMLHTFWELMSYSIFLEIFTFCHCCI